jgi:ubiquinone/menaquinone biosynthesis C-methylase UbiE
MARTSRETFHDHFSDASRAYAAARPTYPDALYRFIASIAPSSSRAWDCATGNGQAALGLARWFGAVEATDASAEQVAAASADARVHYSVAPAERTPFPDAHFDAVCVAQALHWFDQDAFHAEVHRVLKPGGVFAAWGYDGMRVLGEFDEVFKRAVLQPIHALWPPQNRLLWRGFVDLPFPYERIAAPSFSIELKWTFAQLMDYLGTWTAVKRYIAQGHPDFLMDASDALAPVWRHEGARRVVMPLHLLCGRRRDD